MNRQIVLGVLIGLIVIAGAVTVGFYAYQAGVAQGLVESGKLTAEGSALPDGSIYRYRGGPFIFHHKFGFGFLGCLIPLLFFFLLTKLLFWRRPWFWGWGHAGQHGGPGGHWSHGPGEMGVPPMFEEWHRQAHSGPSGSASEPPAGPK